MMMMITIDLLIILLNNLPRDLYVFCRRTEKAFCDSLFTNLVDFVKHIPATPGPEMFDYVINVLSKTWHHDAQYSQCFK